MTSFEHNSERNDGALPATSKPQSIGYLNAGLEAPIHHIISLADILANTELDAEQRTFVNMIARSARTLSSTFSDIVDIAQLEEGALEVAAEPFELRNMLDDLDLIFAAQALEKTVEFKTDIQDTVPEALIGDEKRLHQIISNVLGHAIKFTERGTVALTVSATFLGDDARLTLTVEDCITQEIDAAHSSSEMRIAHALIDLMGGAIHIEDNNAQGRITTIALAMPYVQESKDRPIRVDHLEGVRVLLLANDSDAHKELTAGLNEEGLDACLVGDGAIANIFMQAAGKIRAGVDVLIAEHALLHDHLKDAASDNALAAYAKSRIILFGDTDTLAELDFASLEGYATCLTEPFARDDILSAITDVIEASHVQQEPAVVPKKAHMMREASVDAMRPHIAPPTLQPSDERLLSPFDDLDEKPLSFDAMTFEMDADLLSENTSPLDVEIESIASASPLRQVDVLIAEDNEINQLVYGQILSDIDISYKVVDSAEALFTQFDALSPRLVLLDISLPDANGYDVAQNLRDSSMEWGANVPIIGIVAPGKGQNHDACIAARMDDCLAKPISPNMLREKIDYWLGRSANQSVA